MAGIPGIPNNFNVQTANQVNLISWDLSAGATSYIVQRSLDNITYATVAAVSGSPLATSYLDSAVNLGVQYWYRVAASQLTSIQATGSIVFTGQPNAGETASIANIVFTAVASGATGAQFNIGATLADTLVNFATSVNSNLATVVIGSSNSTTLLLMAYTPGIEGNGLELSSLMTNSTVIPFSQGVEGVLSPYTQPKSSVPTPTGEMSLGSIRLSAQQTADRVNSNFVTLPEWNSFINLAMFELYDLLVTVYEDYFMATPVQFVSNGTTFLYPLPNGTLSFTNGIDGTTPFVAPSFYKLLGVDLALNSATNAYVTVNKFNFIDRNRFVYPNTASTIYGVFNLQYRVVGSNIEFIPTPAGGQKIRLWYVPRLQELLQDTDITTTGISGWLRYVIVRAAKYALDKEESDTSKLDQEILFLKARIEETASNRDAGMPDKISDTSQGGWGNGWTGGRNGPTGGF